MLLIPLVSYLSFSSLSVTEWGVEWSGVGWEWGSLTQNLGFRGDRETFSCPQSLLSTGLNSTRQFPNVTPFTRLPVPLTLMSLLTFPSVNIHPAISFESPQQELHLWAARYQLATTGHLPQNCLESIIGRRYLSFPSRDTASPLSDDEHQPRS